MRRILLAIGCVAGTFLATPFLVAQQPQGVRPKVLAFFTPAGELDHFLFAQQAIRAFAVAAEAGGYAFAATSDWDALNDVNLREVRVVIWLNDMPHTAAQRLAFERYMGGGGGWLAIALLVIAAAAVMVSLMVRPPEDLPAAGWRLVLGLTLLFLLAPASRVGYFVYPLGLSAWLLLIRRTPAAGPGPGPGPGLPQPGTRAALSLVTPRGR